MMPTKNLLDFVKAGLLQAGLNANVNISGNELLIEIPPEVAIDLLKKQIPAQYRDAINVREIGKIVLSIKLG